MNNKNRWLIEAVFLTVATIFALANQGWHLTKWALIAFYVGIIGYEVGNYIVIKRRMK